MQKPIEIIIPDGMESPVLTSKTSGSVSGYGLWEFRGEKWTLKQDCSKSGYSCLNPPAAPGAFEGQLRAVNSEPAVAEPAIG